MEDDSELLRRWSEGDTAAGRALYERYYVAIYRFFSTKTSSGLEDLVQDTFTACVAEKGRFRGEGSFRAFLFGTARNVLRYKFRRARVRGHDTSLDDCTACELSPSPCSLLVDRAEQRLLLEGLRRLPLDDQIAFELYYWESMTAGQMAQVLEVSERAVRSRVHRAKQRLREILEDVASSPEVLASTTTDLDKWAASLKSPVRGTS